MIILCMLDIDSLKLTRHLVTFTEIDAYLDPLEATREPQESPNGHPFSMAGLLESQQVRDVCIMDMNDFEDNACDFAMLCACH